MNGVVVPEDVLRDKTVADSLNHGCVISGVGKDVATLGKQ